MPRKPRTTVSIDAKIAAAQEKVVKYKTKYDNALASLDIPRIK